MAKPKILGPNFGNELFAVFPDNPLSFVIGAGEEEIFGRDELTIDQEAILASVIAKHDPNTPAPSYVPYEMFRSRMNDAEIEAVFKAKASNWLVDDFMHRASANSGIVVNTPDADKAKAAFVTAGVLTPERADIVFAARHKAPSELK